MAQAADEFIKAGFLCDRAAHFFRLSYEGISITLDGYHPFLANDNDDNDNDIYIYMYTYIYIHTQMHAQIIHTLDLEGYIHIHIYDYMIIYI